MCEDYALECLQENSNKNCLPIDEYEDKIVNMVRRGLYSRGRIFF